MKKTAVIILNYNTSEDSLNCVDSVEKFNTAPIKYIIVDNNSPRKEALSILTDGLSARFGRGISIVDDSFVTDLPLPVMTIVASGSNDGYAAGNNKGIRLALTDDEVDSILILNNDILFIEDIIPSLIDVQNGIKDCAIISPVLLTADKERIDRNCARNSPSVKSIIRDNFLQPIIWCSSRMARKYAEKRYLPILKQCDIDGQPVMDINLPSGSCMLIRKDFLKESNGLDETTFLYYEEDILSKMVEAHRMRSCLSLSDKCVHLGSATISKCNKLFIIKSCLRSQRYFVTHYLNPSFFFKSVYLCSYYFLLGYCNMKELFKRLLKK